MWEKIKPEELHENPFSLIGEDWMLVAASDGERVNAMTASWGGVGILWGKKVAFIFVRPQRYTKELIDKSDKLSLSFFDEKKGVQDDHFRYREISRRFRGYRIPRPEQ